MFIMGSQRREFSPEYKDEAVKLVVDTGRPVARVARELGLKEQTLGRWVNLFKARQGAGDESLSVSERAELVQLRKDVSDLKLDRAFLSVAFSPRRSLTAISSNRGVDCGEILRPNCPGGGVSTT